MPFIDDLSSYTPDTGDDLTELPGSLWTAVSGETGFAFGVTDVGGVNVVETIGSGGDAVQIPDQGAADHYLIVKRNNFDTDVRARYVVRFVDRDNYVAIIVAGGGGAGRRLVKKVGGTETNMVTSQGVSGEWLKVEAEGDQYTLFAGGTGATPVWVQVGSSQTVSDSDISTSETRIGLDNDASPLGHNWFSYFEAGALGGGGTTVSVAPIQSLNHQYAAIAATKLNGVLQ